MRFVAVAVLVATFAFARESSAQTRSWYSSASGSRGRGNADCPMARCGLPILGVATGGGASVYVGAWAARRGELPVVTHVGGALVGALAITIGVLYATTTDPAPRYQVFGSAACIAVGLPAVILGLHGLITAETELDEEKPGSPVPNWYGPGLMRVHGGPTAIADARGALSPGVSLGGAF